MRDGRYGEVRTEGKVGTIRLDKVRYYKVREGKVL